jgi:hypothetical protein
MVEELTQHPGLIGYHLRQGVLERQWPLLTLSVARGPNVNVGTSVGRSERR